MDTPKYYPMRQPPKKDDWAEIGAFKLSEWDHEMARRAEQDKINKAALRETLDRQIRERKAMEDAEKKEDWAYFKQECKELAAWEQEEKEKKKQQFEKLQHLKSERDGQMQEKAQIRATVEAKKRREEERARQLVKEEVRRKLQDEDRMRKKQQADMEAFLAANEANKKIREENKRRMWAEDQKLAEDYARKLDEEDRKRAESLAKMDEEQRKRREAAHKFFSQAENDESELLAKIAAHAAAYEKAANERDEARKKAVKQREEETKAMLDRQHEEKVRRRQQEKEAEMKQHMETMSIAERELAAERELKNQERIRKLEYKRELQRQMEDNARRRAGVLSMDGTERKINKDLLEHVTDWKEHDQEAPKYLKKEFKKMG